jgi:hypothetical protein
MKNLKAALFLSLVAQFATAAPINLVQNGDFEAAVAGPGDVPGWVYSGGDSYFGVDADYIGSPAARPGQVFYDGAATNTGYLSQNIATIAGATYTLEFDLQRWASSTAISNFASVNFGAATVFAEQDIGSDWTHFMVSGLVGGPGAFTLLQFTNLNLYDFNQLDNISLVAADRPPVDVPEPATPYVLAAVLGACLLARRRRPD